MALVKYGGGIIQMSGSIAGNTHARNRYGNYIRAKTKPVNPNTARQQAVRSAVGELTARWSQTLTDAKRIAWQLYADSVNMKNRLGEVIHLSGFNHYIRSNVPRILFSKTIIDDGPVIFELPGHDPLFAVAISENTQHILTTFSVDMDWSTEADAFLFVSQGQPQNPQRNFFAGPWRTATAIRGEDPGPPISPWDSAVSFAVAELQRIWCYGRIARADGRLSEVFRADCFCGA